MNHFTCSIDNFLQTEIQISFNKEKKSISGIRAAYEQKFRYMLRYSFDST